jgi:hypothetical protein
MGPELKVPPSFRVLRRLAALYQAWGKQEQAARYRAGVEHLTSQTP